MPLFYKSLFFKLLILAFMQGLSLCVSADEFKKCFHWYNDNADGDITHKIIENGKAHGGDLLFKISDQHDSASGIYCNTDITTGSMFGNRVIEIEFNKDVVIFNGKEKTCGSNGNYYTKAQCSAKTVDVKYPEQDGVDWYYIPAERKSAIKSWSVTSESLEKELKDAKDKMSGQHSELVKFEQLIVQVARERKSGSPSAIRNSKSRTPLDDHMEQDTNLSSSSAATYLARLSSSTLGASEREKIAARIFRFYLKENVEKLKSSDVKQLVSNVPAVKKAYFDVLIANPDIWSKLGNLFVLDQVYFSGLPQAQVVKVVNQIIESLYGDLKSEESKGRLRADMKNSTALKTIYERQSHVNQLQMFLQLVKSKRRVSLSEFVKLVPSSANDKTILWSNCNALVHQDLDAVSVENLMTAYEVLARGPSHSDAQLIWTYTEANPTKVSSVFVRKALIELGFKIK